MKGVAKHACEPSTSSTTRTIWVISAICAGAKAAAPLPRRSSSGEEAEAEVEVEVAARSRWYLRFSKARSALMRCSSSAATPGKGHACHIIGRGMRGMRACGVHVAWMSEARSYHQILPTTYLDE